MSQYLEVLKKIRESGRAAPAESDAEREGLDRFRDLFRDLSAERVQELAAGVYAPDVYFNDTLKEIHGVDALVPYLVDSAEGAALCRVDVQDVARGTGDYYLRWTMDIEFARFDKGVIHRSIGMSHLRLDDDGRILLHQDYWDAASGLFEHLPVLGWGIRRVKARL